MGIKILNKKNINHNSTNGTKKLSTNGTKKLYIPEKNTISKSVVSFSSEDIVPLPPKVCDGKNECCILCHWGMGDQIIINGLVRFLANTKFKRVHVLVPNSHGRHKVSNDRIRSVIRMYKDCRKINVFGEQYLNSFREENSELSIVNIRCGKTSHLDFTLYKMANVPLEERWNSWYLERNVRDKMREVKLFRELNLPNEYIFVHDSYSGGPSNLRISSKLPIVRPYIAETIFDWIRVIERAKEIHCVYSSFFNFVNSLDHLNSELYFHNSISRRANCKPYFNKSQKWNVVNYVHPKKKKKKRRKR